MNSRLRREVRKSGIRAQPKSDISPKHRRGAVFWVQKLGQGDNLQAGGDRGFLAAQRRGADAARNERQWKPLAGQPLVAKCGAHRISGGEDDLVHNGL